MTNMLSWAARRAAAASIAVVLSGGLLIAGAPPAFADRVAPPALPPAPESPPAELSVDRAIADARRSGQPVEATAAASPTDTVTGNPDGTVTLSRTALPTRKQVNGRWLILDPTLLRNPDGTLSPTVGAEQLTLSGGGTAPMATMGDSRLAAAIGAPMSLPVPTVSGPTATYSDVLPGVDLQVTAMTAGGVSDVLVVHDATAAKNPALAELALSFTGTGMKVTSDSEGNITGTDRIGRGVLSAPAPTMWDSTPTSGPTLRAADGVRVDAATRRPAASTFQGPGAGARIKKVKALIRHGRIELTPDSSLLTGAATHFPVFIDPTFTWSSAGASNSGWATVARNFPNTKYWKSTPDPSGRMQVGNPGEIWSHTLINFPIPTGTLAGAHINTATVKITETRSWSCTPSRVNMYAPSATLTSSNATWNYWDDQDLGPVVDYQNVAHGYNSSCPAAGVAFDVKSTVIGMPSSKKTQTFVLTGSNEGSDNNSWKEFLETSPTLEITYNHEPNRPIGLTTSPATSCAAASPTTIGDSTVILYAPVSDNDHSNLGVRFNLWKTSTPATILASSNPNLLTYHSGSTAVLKVPVQTLRTAAGSTITQFSWRVQVTDFNLTGDWSVTCNFKYDPTRPGQPDITVPAEDSATIGQSVVIPIAPADSGTPANSYLYQLNGGPYGTVNTDAGTASITVIPSRFTNSVTVTGLSPSGNVGETATATFNAKPGATATDGDLTGDSQTDLVTAGGTHNLASGLWLAVTKDTGQLAPAATDIGAHGNGEFLTGPGDFDGAQVSLGRFAGSGLQDVLAYYPSGPHAGQAVILRGSGDGSTIQTQLDGTVTNMATGTFTDAQSLDPQQLANAGNPTDSPYPDLIGVAGSTSTGYYLNRYPNYGAAGGYSQVDSLPSQETPTGGTDWDTWTIATAQSGTTTDMYLWQRGTGKLYLWDNLAFDETTAAFTYTQYTLADNWNTGQTLTLQASDIDGDGTADLWAVGNNATATPWLINSLTDGSGTIAAQPTQKLLTGTHAWLLNDAQDGPVTGANIAHDSIGALHLTGTGSAAWNTGDLYDPDVNFDGTNPALATTKPAFATDADFTISAWVKPSATTGTVISQDGHNTSGFKLYAEPLDSSWRFAMTGSDAAAPAWTLVASRPGTLKLGVWALLTASYKRSTGVLDLHVNGADAGTATLTSPWNATGVFRVAATRTGSSAVGLYFSGQIAEVETFDQVVNDDRGNPAVWDFNGDQKPDIIASHTNSGLYLYRGNGAGGFQNGNGAVIGNGWASFDTVFTPGDFTGDGNPDIIARKPNGNLLLYRGNGAGGFQNGNGGTVIGTGFNSFNLVFSPGDFNGDGKTDVITRATDGSLHLYRGNGTGGWIDPSTNIQIGTGFNTFNYLFGPGDFNGDGKTDMIARAPDGGLYLYRGNGTGGWIDPAHNIKIGVGWGTFSSIL